MTKSYNRNRCLEQYGCWYFISTDFVIKSLNTQCLKMFKAYLGLFLFQRKYMLKYDILQWIYFECRKTLMKNIQLSIWFAMERYLPILGHNGKESSNQYIINKMKIPLACSWTIRTELLKFFSHIRNEVYKTIFTP